MTVPSQEAEFREMFDANHRAIQAYCWRRLPASVADDAAADVFLTAWRRIDTAPGGEELRMWLYGIARNVVRNAARSTNRRQALANRWANEPERHQPGPETIVVRNQEDEQRLAALDRLRPEEREIVLLRAWEGLTSRQIAAVLGLTPKAVDNRLARIRTKLSKLLAVPAGSRKPGPHSLQEGGER